MIQILDDVLSEEDRQACIEYWKTHQLTLLHWHTTAEYWQSILIQKAREVFDLKTMVGFECWSHKTTKPQWHVDQDEGLKEVVTPLCSLVYYPIIENLIGGKFLTETETIVPRTNRLLIFSPGIYHGVENFVGTRHSVAINIWHYKPTNYKHDNIDTPSQPYR
jgi:hypothetical protein